MDIRHYMTVFDGLPDFATSSGALGAALQLSD